MSRSLAFLALVAALALAGGAAAHDFGRHPGIEGSGDLETRGFDLDEFRSLRLDGYMDIHVVIGDERRCEVTTDDNLFDNLVLEVDDGELLVDWREECHAEEARLELVVPRLDRIRINGAGDVEVERYRGERFEFHLRGASELEIEGEVDEFVVRLDGAGEVEAFDLEAKRVDVRIAGAGEAEVTATDEFAGVVTGVGEIAYRGDPGKVSESVRGIGEIERR
jgi:hypothetical protein